VHKLEGVSLNALSFSPDPSAVGAQIGWSPLAEPLEMYRQFKENAEMKKTIFETVRSGLAASGWAKDMAATYGSGWMHIPDGRTLAPFGRYNMFSSDYLMLIFELKMPRSRRYICNDHDQ
jgi:hypothetical protein